jgi:hypothetical protein
VSDHTLLEPRHVDALTESVRALTMTIARAEEQRVREHRALMAAIEKLAIHTENLPALMDALESKSNGTTHQENDNDR